MSEIEVAGKKSGWQAGPTRVMTSPVCGLLVQIVEELQIFLIAKNLFSASSQPAGQTDSQPEVVVVVVVVTTVNTQSSSQSEKSCCLCM